MKCVKSKDGTIKRISDLEAYRLVSSGEYSYTSKTEWKNQIYGLDYKTRKDFPANVDGSPEFNEVIKKDKKEKEKKKKEEYLKKRQERIEGKSKNHPKKK